MLEDSTLVYCRSTSLNASLLVAELEATQKINLANFAKFTKRFDLFSTTVEDLRPLTLIVPACIARIMFFQS